VLTARYSKFSPIVFYTPANRVPTSFGSSEYFIRNAIPIFLGLRALAAKDPDGVFSPSLLLPPDLEAVIAGSPDFMAFIHRSVAVVIDEVNSVPHNTWRRALEEATAVAFQNFTSPMSCTPTVRPNGISELDARMRAAVSKYGALQSGVVPPLVTGPVIEKSGTAFNANNVAMIKTAPAPRASTTPSAKVLAPAKPAISADAGAAALAKVVTARNSTGASGAAGGGGGGGGAPAAPSYASVAAKAVEAEPVRLSTAAFSSDVTSWGDEIFNEVK